MNPARRSRLPQLELDCMKVLWKQPGSSVAEVRSALDRPLAYTTVMTVLDRMTGKGVVTRRKNGRAWHYSAQLDRETARIEAVDRLLSNLFDDDRGELVEYLSRRRVARPAAAAPTARQRPKTRVARPAAPRTPAPSAIDEFLL